MLFVGVPAGSLIASRPAGAQSSPAVVGAWSAVQNWPVIAIHSHALPTGEVLMFPRGLDHDHQADVRIWNPETGQFTASIPNNRTNVFCAGHSFLPDGRLLVTGGHLKPWKGVKDTNIFNPFDNTWSTAPDMNGPRWYPTNVTLANGEVLVAGGTITQRRGTNKIPQVFTRAGTWRTLRRGGRDVGIYPLLHLAPNGKVFMAGPMRRTAYLSTGGQGRWTTVADRTTGSRAEGISVLYDDGRVLTAGGGDPPKPTAEVIDLRASRPRWRRVGSMSVARRQLNGTLLPDGTVLITGGTAGPGFNNERAAVLTAELWNPQTEAFTTVAPMTIPRIYHSTALLLPDGRVLAAGGEGEGGTPRPNAEIYSPPYLFRGNRPQITDAPSSVSYGQSFTVSTPDAANIRGVSWLRLGSVTHCVNMDQRINRLLFSAGGGALTVTAPSDPRLCPPGHYMLFILDANGVPSVSRIIQIG